MKNLPALTAALAVAALVLAPVASVSAVSGSISLSAGGPYNDSQMVTISGVASPSPGSGFNILVTVTNPAAYTVYEFPTPVDPSTGAYSVSFTIPGGNPHWVSGIYSVTASLNPTYTNGTGSFQYTAAPPAPSGNALTVLASASSPVFAGQTAQVQAYVFWSSNGTALSSAATVTGWWVNPAMSVSSASAGMSEGSGFWMWSVPLSSSAPDGNYLATIKASSGQAWGYGSAGFTVNSGLASASGLTAIGGQLTALGTSVSALTSSVAALSSTVASDFATTWSAIGSLRHSVSANFSATWSAISGLGSAITTATTGLAKSSDVTAAQSAITSAITSATSGLATASSISSLSSAVAALPTSSAVSGIASSVSTLSSNVSSTQTYVLVVAVLAAITLVLELAVLIRKLS